ncbi:MAG: Rpn family recombination-promoting nuclease/putative transposase [Treponema sp.]|nr:Rpn family recombination-promoting nuclease/putative transposase [Candidatus Treponema caballi]
MAQSNRNVKDSVFADLFSNEQDGKRNFLSLYNALHGTHLKYEETVIENKTIPQSMYKTFHNDVSMLIDNKLIVMIEHQSTINENMPFRLLEYVTRIYEGIVPSISDRGRLGSFRMAVIY